MFTFKGKALKADLSIDTIVGWNGETYYVVCDSVGVLFTTIFEDKLQRFFA